MGFARGGVYGGILGTPVDLPQSGLDFRNQLQIGHKILRELASGFRRVHGEEPSKPSKPSVFIFVGFFKEKFVFFWNLQNRQNRQTRQLGTVSF